MKLNQKNITKASLEETLASHKSTKSRLIFGLCTIFMFPVIAFSFKPKKNPSTLCSGGERILFSFETKKGQLASLCQSSVKNNGYLVYRFGFLGKIEMEYPKNRKDSYSKFTYKFYMRGGGTENDAEDLNSLEFDNNGTTYSIYQDMESGAQGVKVGISVKLPNKDRAIDIKGIAFTATGTLADLRGDERVNQEEGF